MECEAPDLDLKRQYQNELICDMSQKRGENGACGVIMRRNPDQSVAGYVHFKMISAALY